jgi:hypothetical protein
MKKNFLYLFMAAVLPMGFAACDDPTELPDKYDPDKRTVQLAAATTGGVVEVLSPKSTLDINVVTNQSQWVVSVDSNDWCLVNRQNSYVHVEVDSNKTALPRSVYITLKNATATYSTRFMLWQAPQVD